MKSRPKALLVGGAFMREELAILTLEPTTVQPHIHAILCQPDVGVSAVEILGRWVRAYCEDLGQQVELDPSIDFQPIPTEDDFERIMTYLLKPLDVVTSYRARWAKVDGDAGGTRLAALYVFVHDGRQGDSKGLQLGDGIQGHDPFGSSQ